SFCHLLERMMAKDPFHRYQTPYELLQDIRRVIKGKQPVGIRPPAGRSSIARPELHQDSQRVEPLSASSSHELPNIRAPFASVSKPAAAQSGPRNPVPPQAQSGPRNPAVKNPRAAQTVAP